uniref:Uncharacterized protein n=1 Tax=Anguilla anguilla TaxID=7936 RepID=A0A0E9WPK9_ANGAN
MKKKIHFICNINSCRFRLINQRSVNRTACLGFKSTSRSLSPGGEVSGCAHSYFFFCTFLGASIRLSRKPSCSQEITVFFLFCFFFGVRERNRKGRFDF